MSYVSRKSYGKIRVPVRPVAVGGFFSGASDLLFGSVSDTLAKQIGGACVGPANAKLADMDRNIAEADASWKPSGFYTPDQIAQIVNFVGDVGMIGSRILNEAIKIRQTDAATDALATALNKQTDVFTRFRPFIDAFNQARAQGVEVIDAPGLKRVAIDYLKATRDVRFVAEVNDCQRPEYLSLLDTLDRANNAVTAFLKTTGSVALELGKQVLKVPDLIGDVLKFGPFVALGVAAIYLASSTGLFASKSTKGG